MSATVAIRPIEGGGNVDTCTTAASVLVPIGQPGGDPQPGLRNEIYVDVWSDPLPFRFVFDEDPAQKTIDANDPQYPGKTVVRMRIPTYDTGGGVYAYRSHIQAIALEDADREGVTETTIYVQMVGLDNGSAPPQNITS